LIYIALAELIGCPLVTADLKLYNTLKKSPLKKSTLWVEDVP
jgi:predicted nucleic acid-binding protein